MAEKTVKDTKKSSKRRVKDNNVISFKCSDALYRDIKSMADSEEEAVAVLMRRITKQYIKNNK